MKLRILYLICKIDVLKLISVQSPGAIAALKIVYHAQILETPKRHNLSS